MGVHDLWSLLCDICERKPLTFLSGKTVAVDLSGWVVQAVQCPGLSNVRNPHIRNLFFRVLRLLQLDVFPIFVMEGQPPLLKEQAIKKRNCDYHSEFTARGAARPAFDNILNECQDMLSCFGVPCVKSSGEAEAFCAYLFINGIVDGVITEDNDAFLYGAGVVYKDFSIDDKDPHVNVYDLQSKNNKLNLNREKLVALALLLGCDYSDGVPGIGKETASKLLSQLKEVDILKRFDDWIHLSEAELFPGLENKVSKKPSHCSHCGHLGSSAAHKKLGCIACNSDVTCYLEHKTEPCKCSWHKYNSTILENKTELKIISCVKKCPSFPEREVIREYLNFMDTVPDKDTLKWNTPSLSAFQQKASKYLGWEFDYSCTKFLPIITAWQQYQLKCGYTGIQNFIYEPIRIVRERFLKDIDYYEVEWRLIDRKMEKQIYHENVITVEYSEMFSKSYKDFVEKYISSKEPKGNKVKKLKSGHYTEGKATKRKSKKSKMAENCRKIYEFLPVRRHAQRENCSGKVGMKLNSFENCSREVVELLST